MSEPVVREGPVSPCPRIRYEKERSSAGWIVFGGALFIGAPVGWYVEIKALGALVGLW